MSAKYDEGAVKSSIDRARSRDLISRDLATTATGINQEIFTALRAGEISGDQATLLSEKMLGCIEADVVTLKPENAWHLRMRARWVALQAIVLAALVGFSIAQALPLPIAGVGAVLVAIVSLGRPPLGAPKEERRNDAASP